MKITLKGHATSTEIGVKMFTFSGGEEQVQVDKLLEDSVQTGDKIVVEHEIRSSSDLMRLVMVKSVIDEMLQKMPGVQVILVMWYIPYARQDRACEPGEALAVKPFSKILNSLKFDRVIVADPHSDVSAALLDNVTIIPQETIVKNMLQWYVQSGEFAIVSPDAGAMKKIFKVAKSLGEVEVFCAEKIRDTKTGAIVETKISVEDFKGKNLLIVDDLCDGGRTFIELAKILKERNAGKIDLYVTHGIFSKGVDVFDGMIDTVHTMNLWEDNIQERSIKEGQTFLHKNQAVIKNFILREEI